MMNQPDRLWESSDTTEKAAITLYRRNKLRSRQPLVERNFLSSLINSFGPLSMKLYELNAI